MTVHGIDDLVVLDLPARQPWIDDALCAQVDTEIFYPEKGGTLRPAKRICRDCPVINECLEWALDNDLYYGVFGGKSAPQRRRILKARENGTPA